MTDKEKVKLLKEALTDLLFHFQDYGMESESLVLLMEVEKSWKVLRSINE